MDFWETLKQKYHILEMYFIFTSSSTPGMGPGVGCHLFIANTVGNIWSKYDCFLISGSQGMDFQETLMQKTRILKMY